MNAVSSYVVGTTTDDANGVAGNCGSSTASTSCTLRDALAAANTAGAGIITFDPAVFGSGGTITLTSGGTLSIPASTYIQGLTSGSGASLTNLVTVSGANAVTVFVATFSGGQSYLNNLNITQGYDSSSDGRGGGIYNATTLTVNECNIFQNSSAVNGGGISNSSI